MQHILACCLRRMLLAAPWMPGSSEAAQEISCFLSTITSGSRLFKRVLFEPENFIGLRIAQSLKGSCVEIKGTSSQMGAVRGVSSQGSFPFQQAGCHPLPCVCWSPPCSVVVPCIPMVLCCTSARHHSARISPGFFGPELSLTAPV